MGLLRFCPVENLAALVDRIYSVWLLLCVSAVSSLIEDVEATHIGLTVLFSSY